MLAMTEESEQGQSAETQPPSLGDGCIFDRIYPNYAYQQEVSMLPP